MSALYGTKATEPSILRVCGKASSPAWDHERQGWVRWSSRYGLRIEFGSKLLPNWGPSMIGNLLKYVFPLPFTNNYFPKILHCFTHGRLCA